MKELEVKYEMSYTFDEQDLLWINDEIAFLKHEYPNIDEEECLEHALYSYLHNEVDCSESECETIISEHFDAIYKWWKENKENV